MNWQRVPRRREGEHCIETALPLINPEINLHQYRQSQVAIYSGGGTFNPPLLQTNSHWTHNSLHNSLRYTGLF